MRKPSLHRASLFMAVLLVILNTSCTGGSTTSPESTLLFRYAGKTGPEGIWKMNADGSGITQLTDFGWFARYSPDNSKIAFGKPYADGIWVANADGSSPIQLTDTGSAPDWSPDGSRLAFHTGGTKGADRYIWIMNADGSDAYRLSQVNGSFPVWSPSGATILFHGEVNNGIWQIDPDGSNEKMLYRDGGYPAWSPGGEQVAYVNLSDWCIWVMDVEGMGQRKLTDHPGSQPVWSPDGLQIAYERVKQDHTEIWVIKSDGTDAHQISKTGSHSDWSN
jgi:TolB protein